MKFNKITIRILSLVLSILLVCVPVFGTELETGAIRHFGLASVFDYDPYNITFVTSAGYIVVDQVEFLNAVVQGFMSNLNWERYVNFSPYSVQHCEVNNKYYRCITAPRFDFTIDTSYGSYVSINGYSYQTGLQYTFPNSTSDLYFDRAITLSGQQSTASGHTTKTAYAYGIYINPSIWLMICDDADNSINVITDYLNSIRLNVNTIVSSQSTAITFLSNLYTAVSSISSDISTVKTYLGSIDTNISAISSTCSSILNQTEVNGQLLEDINDYITDHLPIIENDLYTINSSISSFRSDFNTFALSCLSSLNSIDTTTQSIDDNLDELLQLQKGTALQDVNVTTSGGSTFSLWSIIKNSVNLGLSATGGFFSGLFDLLGIFGQYSNGFSAFTTLSQVSPVSYIPEDLSISNVNLIPDYDATWNQAGYNAKFIRTGTTIRAIMSSNASRDYSVTIQNSFTLEPGNYLLYATGSEFVSIVLRVGSSNFGSIVTLDNYPFSINQSTTFTIICSMDDVGKPIDHNFNLKVVKTG